MNKLLDLVHRSRVLPILGAGGVGFVLQLAIFEVLAVYLGVVSHSVATVIGAEVGILTNFFINDKISFSHHAHKASLPTRLVRHQAVVLVAVCLQWFLVYTAEHMTTDVWLIRLALLVGIGLGFIWNYVWYHLYVWKHHHPPEL